MTNFCETSQGQKLSQNVPLSPFSKSLAFSYLLNSSHNCRADSPWTMPSTFNLVNLVKRHVLFWSLTLALVSSSVTPRRPVLTRIQSKPPKLKVAPHRMHGFKGLSPRFQNSEISTATNTHVPRPGEEIVNSDCCGGNAPDHRVSVSLHQH
ncbi:uncharacterized protein PGTG_13305 [Puccinia graminis f. sp. tritici CRL 75-36-700-3]|uniref:Uncharacterized protein n=1 Tax=Puccinia graminis f. sp. tritici (strain CRL 75-36-700-3 / race SCCL) TaxID=418459 RepID=E3KS11_PUCGT|nr:uncharacterized protein PGTG_13305 [Puccinia graminis f. sp. tritici CRL 75-36-700-3]EFP87086.2 hypothetical protein PGTG_13305 [Puccinia graminis f. sp. tritici CRL 75-36-700-3]